LKLSSVKLSKRSPFGGGLSFLQIKNQPLAGILFFNGGPEARRTLSTSISRKELYQIYWGESVFELGTQ
jgi:hypothetical protein